MESPKLILSIMIASIEERSHQLNLLLDEFERQINEHNLNDKVEICYIVDNKEMTIGAKRNGLLNMSRGKWVVFIDDDDAVCEYYVPLIVQKLEQYNPDCLGFKIKMTTNGSNIQFCEHSLKHENWITLKQPDVNGIKYYRNVTHFNPVRRSIAMKVGFDDTKRFGEDKLYSDKITKLCNTEYYLDIPYLFEYRYSNKQKHNDKYGIK